MLKTRICLIACPTIFLAVVSSVVAQRPEVTLGERINTRWSVVKYPRNRLIPVTFRLVLPEVPPPPDCPDCPQGPDSEDTFAYAFAEVTIKDAEMEIDLRLQRLEPSIYYYLYAVDRTGNARRLMEIQTDNEGKMEKKQTWPSGDVIDTFMLVIARNDNIQTFGPDTPVTLISQTPPGLFAKRRPR